MREAREKQQMAYEQHRLAQQEKEREVGFEKNVFSENFFLKLKKSIFLES